MANECFDILFGVLGIEIREVDVEVGPEIASGIASFCNEFVNITDYSWVINQNK